MATSEDEEKKKDSGIVSDFTPSDTTPHNGEDGDAVQVTSRTVAPSSAPLPSVNLGQNGKTVMLKPQVSQQPTPEEKAQQDLIDRGASYVGKDLSTLMKENPTMRPKAFMDAMNAYNLANGKEKFGWEDTAAFYGDHDPYKSSNEVKKDRRRMLWADGINEFANVLQNVVNYANGTNAPVDDIEKKRERSAQLRRYMDEQRVQRLNALMSNIKAENDAKRAAAAEQLKMQHQLVMKQAEFNHAKEMEKLKWDNPKVQADIDEIRSKINLNDIKSQVELQNLLAKELENKFYPKKMAAEIAKTWADKYLTDAKTKNEKVNYEGNVIKNYASEMGVPEDKPVEIRTGDDAKEHARKLLGIKTRQ